MKSEYSEQSVGSSQNDATLLHRSFSYAVSFAIFLWLIKIFEQVFSFNFVDFGIYPRVLSGLKGLLFAPLIHGSFSHLFANTAPIIILGSILLYSYAKSARIVLPSIYFGTGLCVWLFARNAYHIGASGLTFGMLFYVLVIGILRWDRKAIAFSLIVFFLYGSMIWGIFPTTSDISFESHLAGAILGIILAINLKNYDPKPHEKHYDWEDDQEADDYQFGQFNDPSDLENK